MPDFPTLADIGGALAIGYLLGSIPFGVIFTRLAGFGDIRTIGSGNIGATNVLRTGQRGLAAATLVADGVKGAVAVLIGLWIGGEWPPLAAAVGAFVGHLFPLWLDFKRRQGRGDLSRRPHCSRSLRGVDLRHGVARRRLGLASLVGRRARRQPSSRW